MRDVNTIGNISVANGFGWVVRIARVDGVGPTSSYTGLTTHQYPTSSVLKFSRLKSGPPTKGMLSVRCRAAELRQFAGKGRRNGRAGRERHADCGNYPRNALPRATVRSIGTGWRLVQAQRAMR